MAIPVCYNLLQGTNTLFACKKRSWEHGSCARLEWRVPALCQTTQIIGDAQEMEALCQSAVRDRDLRQMFIDQVMKIRKGLPYNIWYNNSL